MLAMVKANLLVRWGRSALTGLGVAVGVTTVVALLAVTGGLSRSAGDLAKLGRADFGVFQAGLADLTASSLPDSIVPRIAAIPGVAAVSPVQIVSGAVSGDSSILLSERSPAASSPGAWCSSPDTSRVAPSCSSAPPQQAACTPLRADR